jgi:hypothetical protein
MAAALTVFASCGVDDTRPAAAAAAVTSVPPSRLADDQRTVTECASRFTAAMQSRDWNVVVDLIRPEVVVESGGREACKAMFATVFGETTLRFQRYVLTGEVQVARDGDAALAIVPTILEASRIDPSGDEVPLLSEGYLIALVAGVGDTWHLMDGSDEAAGRVRRSHPRLANELSFPQRRQTIGDDGAHRPKIVEVEEAGTWQPTDETRAALQQLLQRAPSATSTGANDHDVVGLATSDYASQSYRDVTNQFTIGFPKGWSIKDGATAATLVKAVCADRVHGTQMILIRSVLDNWSDDVWRVDPQEMHQRLSHATPTLKTHEFDGGKIKLCGEHALWFCVHVEIDGAHMRSINYIVQHGSKLLWIVGSSDGSAETFTAFRPLFEASAESIVFR